jgi:hypothetical protein
MTDSVYRHLSDDSKYEKGYGAVIKDPSRFLSYLCRTNLD